MVLISHLSVENEPQLAVQVGSTIIEHMVTQYRAFHFIALMALSLLISSCTTTVKDQQVVDNLWAAWEKSEVLSQVDYPDAVPIVLIHGWNGGEFTWPVPERLIVLEQKLGRDIFLFTYRTGIFANRYPPLEVLEEQLDRYLAPYQEVDLVAHSMGGLLVRQYLSHHADHRVRRVAFLATPHFGTNVAQVLVQLGSIKPEGNIQATEIQPGSDFLWQLNALNGSELEGVEVLNAYAAKQRILDSDLIVAPSSAHLPWGHNIVILGDHHALARHLDEQEAVISFLKEGRLPQAQPMPERRDVWLRFIIDGKVARLSEANFKSYDVRGLPNKDFAFCCELRSGINSQAGDKTLILDTHEKGNSYRFLPYRGRKPLQIRSDELMHSPQPVTMIEFNLDQPLDKEAVDETAGESVDEKIDETELQTPEIVEPAEGNLEIQPVGIP